MPRYFPIAIALEGRACLVVGGGSVAARRVTALLDGGASVTVVAPEVCAELLSLSGEIVVEARPYASSDSDGRSVVIAATDQPAVNSRVIADARERGIWACDAGSAEFGDFVIPSTIRRGDLLISVTTGGSSPALSSRIRDEIAERYPARYADYVQLLGEARELVLTQAADPKERQNTLRSLADDGILLELILQGRVEEAWERMLACISSSSA